MGGMRFSKKRKIAGLRMKPLTLQITEDARAKLDRIAGPESLAATVEELVIREYRRREKRLSQQVQENTC